MSRVQEGPGCQVQDQDARPNGLKIRPVASPQAQWSKNQASGKPPGPRKGVPGGSRKKSEKSIFRKNPKSLGDRFPGLGGAWGTSPRPPLGALGAPRGPKSPWGWGAAGAARSAVYACQSTSFKAWAFDERLDFGCGPESRELAEQAHQQA